MVALRPILKFATASWTPNSSWISDTYCVFGIRSQIVRLKLSFWFWVRPCKHFLNNFSLLSSNVGLSFIKTDNGRPTPGSYVVVLFALSQSLIWACSLMMRIFLDWHNLAHMLSYYILPFYLYHKHYLSIVMCRTRENSCILYIATFEVSSESLSFILPHDGQSNILKTEEISSMSISL